MFRNKYLRNSAWQLIEKIARILSNLVIGAVVIRYLGPEQFGLLASALALIAFAEPLAALGLNGIIEREILNTPAQTRQIIKATLLAKTAVGIILSAIIIAYASLDKSNSLLHIIVILSIGKLAFHSHTTFDNYFNSQSRSGAIIRFKLLILCVTEALKLAFVFMGKDVTYFAAITSIQSLLLFLSGSILFAKSENVKTEYQPLSRVKISQLLQKSWPLILSGFAYAIYLKIDVLMLQKLVSDTESGIYASATKLSESWYFLGVSISSSLFPAIIRAKQRSQQDFERHLTILINLLSIVALAAALALFLLSPTIVSLLYGEEFARAADILSIHGFGGIFVFMGFAVSKWLIVEERTIHSISRHGLGALVNVALNLYLIPLHGGSGAATATLISYAFSNLLFSFLFPSTKSLGILLFRSILTNPLHTIKYIKSRSLGSSK